MNNIEELEHRYQRLFSDFQAGKLDEAAFIVEVDKLQFQDNRGRFWMMGAQSGAWHYYDGQTWHQADPRDADNLPFVDEQGRYWQRGAKSGDWYYYNSETKEWVKPGPGDDSRPTPVVSRGEGRQKRASTAAAPTYQSHLYPQTADNAPQFDGELFQDDEGRYWAIGAKTGQWYFYDHAGWHPAREFQPGGAQYQQTQPYQPSYYNQPPQTPYQAPQQPWGATAYGSAPYQPQGPQAYAYPPQQPAYQPPPAPAYTQEAQPPLGQPAYAAPPQPQAAPSSSGGDSGQAKMPSPPGGDSSSGSWFYFDGKQWLKYSSGEPAEAPPPDPKLVIDQESNPAAEPKPTKAAPKGEAVVAEFIEDDEPPVEVVDVEVITVIEAEPDEETPPAPKPARAKESAPTPPLADVDDIKPRRPRQSSDPLRTRPAPGDPQQQPRDRIPTDPGRPVAPRRKEAPHEPTIIIPTGAAASAISSPPPAVARSSRPVPVQPLQQRRARENTVPMEPAPAPSAPAVNRQAVTQPLPAVSRTPRAETGPMRAPAPAKEPTQPNIAVPVASAVQPAPVGQPKPAGHTLGDVLRAFPSTIWTFAGGLIVLIIFAAVIIGAYVLLNGGDGGVVGGVAAIQSPTPTLAAGPPDATPTLGPTPTSSPEPVTTPTPTELTAFKSPALGFTLKYPKGWQNEEDKFRAIFSPSPDGLDPANLKDVALWIGVPEANKTAIADLLAEALAGFPAEAETLNEGTISIASQTWTSTQIRYEDDNLGGQGIATIAVTSKDGAGYYLVAAAPADKWNSTQPVFQEMINSFRFANKEALLAEASSEETPAATSSAARTTAEPETEEGTPSAAAATTSPKATATPKPSPTPKATATPLVYAIQSGDTLLEIALKFGVDVDELAAKNDITDPGKLRLGQELIIPFSAEQLAAYNADGSVPAANDSAAAAGDEPVSVSAAITGTTATTGTTGAAAAPANATEPASANAAPISGRIVYAGFNPGTNNFDLWLADVATGEQTGIASAASQPAFNKDGSLLAYRSWALDSRGIFFRDFIGGRGGQVTRFVEDGLPTWSPDGFSFAFATRREGDRVPRIYRGDQMGQGDFSIGFQGEYPAALPDGRLVVRGCLPSGDCGMFLVGANGGGETKISSERSDTAPAPSPDGSKIAFMSSGRGATNWEVWVMDTNGSNPRRLTDNGNNDGLPTWSPDGKSIAYISDAGGVWSIWVMNADGSNQRKLFAMKGTPDGYVLHDKDNSRGWLEERISWAP
ncbi:MAG: PD40 domain-containing protein [Anaerolineales bacterium]|nr:PD40 domain-containing protein [Anaerolineales bacterium]